MIRALLLFLIVFILPTYSFAKSINPPFSATCESAEAHGYRHGTDIEGKPMDESRTSSEQFFNTKWQFLYSGGSSIIIDGKKAEILEQHEGVIIAGEKASSGLASGIWTYAIHLGLQKVVAAQVNAHGHFEKELQGVKVRAVNSNCKFDIHKVMK